MNDNFGLNNAIFNEMKYELNEMLYSTLKNMIEKNQDEGKVTLNIHLGLMHRLTESGTVILPKITFDCGNSIVMKRKIKGEPSGQYVLEQGEDGIIVRKINGQTMMF